MAKFIGRWRWAFVALGALILVLSLAPRFLNPDAYYWELAAFPWGRLLLGTFLMVLPWTFIRSTDRSGVYDRLEARRRRVEAARKESELED